MITVSRDEYMKFVWDHDEIIRDQELHTHTLSIMQHISQQNNILVAQAVYRKGNHPYYEIRHDSTGHQRDCN